MTSKEHDSTDNNKEERTNEMEDVEAHHVDSSSVVSSDGLISPSAFENPWAASGQLSPSAWPPSPLRLSELQVQTPESFQRYRRGLEEEEGEDPQELLEYFSREGEDSMLANPRNSDPSYGIASEDEEEKFCEDERKANEDLQEINKDQDPIYDKNTSNRSRNQNTTSRRTSSSIEDNDALRIPSLKKDPPPTPPSSSSAYISCNPTRLPSPSQSVGSASIRSSAVRPHAAETDNCSLDYSQSVVSITSPFKTADRQAASATRSTNGLIAAAGLLTHGTFGTPLTPPLPPPSSPPTYSSGLPHTPPPPPLPSDEEEHLSSSNDDTSSHLPPTFALSVGGERQDRLKTGEKNSMRRNSTPSGSTPRNTQRVNPVPSWSSKSEEEEERSLVDTNTHTISSGFEDASSTLRLMQQNYLDNSAVSRRGEYLLTTPSSSSTNLMPPSSSSSHRSLHRPSRTHLRPQAGVYPYYHPHLHDNVSSVDSHIFEPTPTTTSTTSFSTPASATLPTTTMTSSGSPTTTTTISHVAEEVHRRHHPSPPGHLHPFRQLPPPPPPVHRPPSPMNLTISSSPQDCFIGVDWPYPVRDVSLQIDGQEVDLAEGDLTPNSLHYNMGRPHIRRQQLREERESEEEDLAYSPEGPNNIAESGSSSGGVTLVNTPIPFLSPPVNVEDLILHEEEDPGRREMDGFVEESRRDPPASTSSMSDIPSVVDVGRKPSINEEEENLPVKMTSTSYMEEGPEEMTYNDTTTTLRIQEHPLHRTEEGHPTLKLPAVVTCEGVGGDVGSTNVLNRLNERLHRHELPLLLFFPSVPSPGNTPFTSFLSPESSLVGEPPHRNKTIGQKTTTLMPTTVRLDPNNLVDILSGTLDLLDQRSRVERTNRPVELAHAQIVREFDVAKQHIGKLEEQIRQLKAAEQDYRKTEKERCLLEDKMSEMDAERNRLRQETLLLRSQLNKTDKQRRSSDGNLQKVRNQLMRVAEKQEKRRNEAMSILEKVRKGPRSGPSALALASQTLTSALTSLPKGTTELVIEFLRREDQYVADLSRLQTENASLNTRLDELEEARRRTTLLDMQRPYLHVSLNNTNVKDTKEDDSLHAQQHCLCCRRFETLYVAEREEHQKSVNTLQEQLRDLTKEKQTAVHPPRDDSGRLLSMVQDMCRILGLASPEGLVKAVDTSMTELSKLRKFSEQISAEIVGLATQDLSEVTGRLLLWKRYIPLVENYDGLRRALRNMCQHLVSRGKQVHRLPSLDEVVLSLDEKFKPKDVLESRDVISKANKIDSILLQLLESGLTSVDGRTNSQDENTSLNDNLVSFVMHLFALDSPRQCKPTLLEWKREHDKRNFTWMYLHQYFHLPSGSTTTEELHRHLANTLTDEMENERRKAHPSEFSHLLHIAESLGIREVRDYWSSAVVLGPKEVKHLVDLITEHIQHIQTQMEEARVDMKLLRTVLRALNFRDINSILPRLKELIQRVIDRRLSSSSESFFDEPEIVRRPESAPPDPNLWEEEEDDGDVPWGRRRKGIDRDNHRWASTYSPRRLPLYDEENHRWASTYSPRRLPLYDEENHRWRGGGGKKRLSISSPPQSSYFEQLLSYNSKWREEEDEENDILRGHHNHGRRKGERNPYDNHQSRHRRSLSTGRTERYRR